jgi:hypothetical protein
MATTYPKDQFDELPEDVTRVGSHRAPAKRGGGWIVFAWAALATGVLVVGGLFAITLSDNSDADLGGAALTTSTATATPESTVDPITDPADIDADRDISITILNGTTVAGLGTTAFTALDGDGWPVEPAADAKEQTREVTIVYYADAADEDVALGLVAALGTGEARITDSSIGASVRIVLGADYDALVNAE